MIKLNITR